MLPHKLGLQVDETLQLLDTLQNQHRDVSSKTKSLHDSCDRLVRARPQTWLLRFDKYPRMRTVSTPFVLSAPLGNWVLQMCIVPRCCCLVNSP